jgi:serralysin
MYGANFDHNANSSTYTFNRSTGEMFVNGVGQGRPVSPTLPGVIFRTIWDGGGNDTYDLSNFFSHLSIDLRPGSWSDFDDGGNRQRARLGTGELARGHVFNALLFEGDTRSLVENAEGGFGDDTIFGNAIRNVLTGGFGDDLLRGLGGGDFLFGNAGKDALLGDAGNDFLLGGTEMDTLSGGNGNDTLSGGPGVDRILGGDGDDTIVVGADEHFDAVLGGAGEDTLDVREASNPATYDFRNHRIFSDFGGGALEDIEIFEGGDPDDVIISDGTGTFSAAAETTPSPHSSRRTRRSTVDLGGTRSSRRASATTCW